MITLYHNERIYNKYKNKIKSNKLYWNKINKFKFSKNNKMNNKSTIINNLILALRIHINNLVFKILMINNQ